MRLKERRWLILLPLVGFVLSWLAGCSGNTPSLAEAGRPTLVFIYTDG